MREPVYQAKKRTSKAGSAAAATRKPSVVLADHRRSVQGSGGGDPVQHVAASEASLEAELSRQHPTGHGAPNALPAPLQAGVEALSGHDMSDVRVHRNSSLPAQYQALAFAQGRDIHLGPGQEQHLPHEAWHVVQQAQGRVRPTRQMFDAMPVNDDAGLEHEADQMGARASSLGIPARTGFTLSAPGPAVASSPMQAQWIDHALGTMQFEGVSVDVLNQGGHFVWGYMKATLRQSAVMPSVAATIEEACLYLLQPTQVIATIESLTGFLNPYLKILQTIRTVVSLIPQAIRTLLLYGVGWAIHRFGEAYVPGAISESQIAGLLNAGADFPAKLGNIIDFLHKLCTNPTKALYQGLWQVAKAAGWTAAGSLTDWWYGSSGASGQKPAVGTSAQHDNGHAAKRSQQKMIEANLGWFWFEASEPKITQWDDKESKNKRGGLALDVHVGAKLFNHALEAKKAELRVPFKGEWKARIEGVELLSSTIGLGPFLSLGSVRVSNLVISEKGLDGAELEIMALKIAGDLIDVKQLSARYAAASKELAFDGAAAINLYGVKLASQFGLALNGHGGIESGSVGVIAKGTQIKLFKDRLLITNPAFEGSVIKNASPEVRLGADAALHLGALKVDGQRIGLRFAKDKRLVGELPELTLRADIDERSYATLVVIGGHVSADGFVASSVALTYSYGDKSSDEQGKQAGKPPEKLDKTTLSDLIPGFNMDWLRAAGLETLVIEASARDVELGEKGFELTKLDKKPDEKGANGVIKSGEKRADKNRTSVHLKKLSANVFGLHAGFDYEKGEGTLGGKYAFKSNIPGFGFYVPVLPGVSAGVSLAASFQLDASAQATMTRIAKLEQYPNDVPWALGGKAGLTAEGEVKLSAGLGVGVPMLASVHGDLYASVKAKLAAVADAGGMHGIVLINSNSYAMKLAQTPGNTPHIDYNLSAGISANIGAEIRGKFLFVFERRWWHCEIGKWDLGTYRLKGKIFAEEGGHYRIQSEQSGFDKQPEPPQVEHKEPKVADMVTALESSKSKIEDPLALWRMVHDTVDPTSELHPDTRRDLFSRIKQLNASGKDVDEFAHNVNEHVQGRTRGLSISFLMTHSEWVRYSTTHGIVGESARKAIQPIDKLVEEYHRAAQGQQVGVLDRLIEVAGNYMYERSKSRYPMVAKLINDAKREKARISQPAGR